MSKTKAVATITFGEKFWEMAKHTHPLIKQYAERCGADFIVIDKPQLAEALGKAAYEKFQLYRLLEQYDSVAFVDTDILVAPDSPSVFDLTPEGKIGACNEELFSKSKRDRSVTQQVLGKVDWKNCYFNSGMMVLDQKTKELVNPDAEGLMEWATGEFRKEHENLLNDQPFLNHRANKLGMDVEDLGHRFNHTRVITKTHTRFDSYFIHYAGPSGHRYGERIKQIELDSRVMNSPFLLSTSRNFPAYRWIADRSNAAFVKYLISKFSSRPG